MSADFKTAYRPAAADPDVRQSRAPRVWAAALLLSAGWCLIFLGGCFLIGVLTIVNPGAMGQAANNAPLPAEAYVLMWVLYALAFACLAAAVFLSVVGVRGLWRVLTEDPQEE